MIQVCPTDLVHAPPARVWSLLTSPPAVAGWSRNKLRQAPPRPMEPGDRIVFGAGPGALLGVTFRVLRVRPPEELAIDVDLPFGVVNHAVMQVSPAGEGLARVTFN